MLTATTPALPATSPYTPPTRPQPWVYVVHGVARIAGSRESAIAIAAEALLPGSPRWGTPEYAQLTERRRALSRTLEADGRCDGAALHPLHAAPPPAWDSDWRMRWGQYGGGLPVAGIDCPDECGEDEYRRAWAAAGYEVAFSTHDLATADGMIHDAESGDYDLANWSPPAPPPGVGWLLESACVGDDTEWVTACWIRPAVRPA